MLSIKQTIYWKSPYFLKNWMASWNARRLERLRYGSERDLVLKEIREHDDWTPEQFAEYQRQALVSLIRHVTEHVPYYRETFQRLGLSPDQIRSPEDLSKLPILEKQTIKADAVRFLDETLDRRDLSLLHTSGTTGTPLDIYRNNRLHAAALAFFDARCHAMAGMCRRVNPSVSIGGHLVAAPNQTKPPFWVYNRRWKQLYMSSYHLSPEYLAHYVRALRDFKGDYIEGYPSSVYAIARYIVENKLAPVPFKACFTTAETLFDHQREAIREAFGCRTYNQYGCGEMAVFAAECEHGGMHLSPEIGIVEVVDNNDNPVEPGQTGHLICTSLINRVQPFIRYRMGDIGSLKPGRCPCGRPLPMLGQLEGRVDDVLITRDGRRIGRLDPVFKDAKGILEAQIVQDDYDSFRVRIVPSRNYTDADGQAIIDNLAQRLGQVTIRLESVPQIERTQAGKFQAVLCKLPKSAK